MSTNFSFLVRSGQPEPDQSAGQGRSGFQTYKLSMRMGGIENPVTFIQTISKMGLGLKRAHDVVSHITDGETVRVELAEDGSDLNNTLGRLGVDAARLT